MMKQNLSNPCRLRQLLTERPYLRVIEAVNGLEALIIQHAALDTPEGVRTFDALWLSGLCHAAFHGVPDRELLPMEEKLRTVQEIRNVSDKPLFVDCDTGGETDVFCQYAKALEMAGAAAAVIEDKTGEKYNSLYGKARPQRMEEAAVFAEKIRRAKAFLTELLVFARIESLIAGETTAQALERARMYCEAGADGIVIHSASADAAAVFAFAKAFKAAFPQIPLMMIPTAYRQYPAAFLHAQGADVIVYANYLMRSAHHAMQQTALSILGEDCAAAADAAYCTDVPTILKLIEGEDV